MADDVDKDPRAAAVRRIKAKRDFWNHAAAFVIINIALVVIWALSGQGYFWPAWSIFGWGVGLAFHAWSVFGEDRAITEEQIQKEMGGS
ncbi:MAG: 2TM domain-containing protein [Acidimicrobiales bacterium]